MPAPIETAPFHLPNGKTFHVELHDTQRPRGKRIKVIYQGQAVYDTGDCFDFANALSKFDEWLADQLKPEPTLAGASLHG